MFEPDNPIIDSEEEVNQLIHQLENATTLKKHGKCTKFSNTIDNTSISIQSWKFNEWDYGKEKVRLPVNARGLFTIDTRIAVRGYDKFFNINEVPSTRIDYLESNTRGPYELTVKENGCIIFISGLENGQLIVCSKHSTGKRDDLTRNHAVQGEIELAKQLQKVNKSTRDLGKLLFKLNLTAVAELCDDEFEEHVLPYSKDTSGLYLHGLNFNMKAFKTYRIEKVNEFANEWGFKKIDYIKKQTFKELWDFLQECDRTGTYNQNEIEGFVIRCKMNDNDFFFKFKFEEPYLLYRQFREVTKKFISNGLSTTAIISSIKKHKFITLKYLEFIEKLFKHNEQLKTDYLKGYGIIKIRQLFLESLDQSKGIDLIKFDVFDEEFKTLSITDYKYVLIPIATIGCGKTTIFFTLSDLFNWPHIQNDNISTKASKNRLVELSLQGLQSSDVVLVDRNNHQLRERKHLIDSFSASKDNYLPSNIGLKFVAINFITDAVSEEELWDITFNRIRLRGDNHQSIKSESNEKLSKSILTGFIRRFQPLNVDKEPDNQFDLIINLNLNENSSLENSKIVINELNANFPDLIERIPSDKEIELSFEKSLEYRPSFTKFVHNDKKQVKKTKEKLKQISYFGISIEDSNYLINKINEISFTNLVWKQLQNLNRIQDQFHITLGHLASTKNSSELLAKWEALNKIFNSHEIKYEFQEKVLISFYSDIKLKHLVLSENKLVCIEVEILKVFNDNFDEISIDCLNKFPHITIGTFSPEIKPMQSNQILNNLYEKFDTLDNTIYNLNDEKIEVIKFNGNEIIEKQRIFAHF